MKQRHDIHDKLIKLKNKVVLVDKNVLKFLILEMALIFSLMFIRSESGRDGTLGVRFRVYLVKATDEFVGICHLSCLKNLSFICPSFLPISNVGSNSFIEKNRLLAD